MGTESASPSWRDENVVIYFSVKGDGTTGKEWIERPGGSFHVREIAVPGLLTPSFKPTNGVTEVAVFRGRFFRDNCRTADIVRAHARKFRTPDRRRLSTPNPELACLIRKELTDEDLKAMGLWYIVTMHEPIKCSDDDPGLLLVVSGAGDRWLSACHARPDGIWGRGAGFAFVVSPSSV